MKKEKLAIVGGSGLVGQTFIHLLNESHFNELEFKVFASKKSSGQKVIINSKIYTIEELKENSFDDIDYAVFFTTNEVVKKYVPIALLKKVTIIDNSSVYRMNEQVKLIAFGANDQLLSKEDQLIANPNCCIIQCVILLSLLQKYKIKKIIYNTYQSVSGSGKDGIDDLIRCRRGLMPLFYETDISFTCIPKIGECDQLGFSEEENKLVCESKKILNNQEIDVVATCVRVPIMFSHGVSVYVELENEFEVEQIINLFKEKENVVVCEKVVPSSILSCKNDKVYVGRIRKHQSALLFYCVADNVRVGAATNAFNILKRMLTLRKGVYE